MQKNTEISVRLGQLIDYVGVKPAKFASIMGYSRAQVIYDLLDGKAKPSFDFFDRLLTTEYSEKINLRWLIKGDGEMIQKKAYPVSMVGENNVNYIKKGETKCESCRDKEKIIQLLEDNINDLRRQMDRYDVLFEKARNSDYDNGNGQKRKAG